MADRDRRNKTGFDDFVERKGEIAVFSSSCNLSLGLSLLTTNIARSLGRGIIFLLCGQPGVGKTLTAEAGKHNQFMGGDWN